MISNFYISFYSDSSPGSQLVSYAFNHQWEAYMAGRRNYIYALIDGRGSAFQGDKMMHEVYYQLGTPEVEDQIEVTRFVWKKIISLFNYTFSLKSVSIFIFILKSITQFHFFPSKVV